MSKLKEKNMYADLSREQFKNEFIDLNQETVGDINTFCPKPASKEEELILN